MNNNAVDYSTVEKELTKIDSKQPFPHLAKVILAVDYPGLGDAGDILEPESFSKIMKDFVLKTLTEGGKIPKAFMFRREKTFLDKPSPDFFVNLEYEKQ